MFQVYLKHTHAEQIYSNQCVSFYIIIYCLSKAINSVRFIPYNFSLNRSVKTLKNSQLISRNSNFYIILLNVDSVESFIMTLYFLSDIYYVNLPIIATSKMIFLVSINSHNLGNRVILIAYSGNLVSQFFYFWLSATAARAISYWTFFSDDHLFNFYSTAINLVMVNVY